jgi:hypothetical protein
MNVRLRLLSIISILMISILMLPILGMPYDSFTVLASSLLQYQGNKTPTPPPFITVLEVENQDSSAGMVIVKRANVGIRSWILIHNQQDGQPGEMIGAGMVLFGETLDIIIPIDLGLATPVLYASAHADWGQKEVYDPDLDIQTTPFIPFEAILQQEVQPEAPATQVPTEVIPTVVEQVSSPTPIVSDEPATPNPGWLILIICLGAGVAGVVGGIVVFFLLRSRSEGESVDFKEELSRLLARFQKGGSDEPS